MTVTGAAIPAPPISSIEAALNGPSRPRSLPAMRPPMIISESMYPSPVIMMGRVLWVYELPIFLGAGSVNRQRVIKFMTSLMEHMSN